MTLVHPADDDYPDVIAHAIAALLKGGVDAGARELAPIAYPPREIPQRPALPRSVMAAIYVRDGFRCRYCGRRTIPTVIMELLGGLYPEAFPFHRNWKGGRTHPAIISRSPVVDHIVPGSQGGDWSANENLVTACWPCNAVKGDLSLRQLGWTVRPTPDAGWDGLVSSYAQLWATAGRPNPQLHSSWLTAFENAKASLQS